MRTIIAELLEGILGRNWKAWRDMQKSERKNLKEYKKNRRRTKRHMNKRPTHEDMHYEDAVTVPKSKDIYRIRW